jgi:hypothetical protein
MRAPDLEESVIVKLTQTGTTGSLSPESLFPLEDELISVLEDSGVGEFDGNEVALDGSAATLYMYGPDAERLFREVEPILRSSTLCRGATVEIRSGDAAAAAREVRL